MQQKVKGFEAIKYKSRIILQYVHNLEYECTFAPQVSTAVSNSRVLILKLFANSNFFVYDNYKSSRRLAASIPRFPRLTTRPPARDGIISPGRDGAGTEEQQRMGQCSAGRITYYQMRGKNEESFISTLVILTLSRHRAWCSSRVVRQGRNA